MAKNTITAPKGFLATGLHCGIKKSGKPDLALLACPAGATAAAVFTTNKIVAAPVTICKKHIKSRKVYAAIVNSGNANACTGARGLANAIAMCTTTASELTVDPHNILVASTGIIGEQLPIKKIDLGIAKAAKKLSTGPKVGLDFAKAIMTTDTKPKQAVRKIKISGKQITIAAAVKGSGMIGPNMATMLCFITADISITKPLLARALKNAVGDSFNKLTVDGHQSTNDTAMILASGAAGNRTIAGRCPRYKKFTGALADLCADLARQMASDAEGAKRIFTVAIKNAATKADAAKAARAVADYDLVKCAVHGADPNWGRIICAVGSCGVKLNQNKMTCKIGDITVFKGGQPAKFDPTKASKVISKPHHTITINLGAGKYSDFCYGCELSRDYVTINADYHT
ncbi:MAG: bifunctional glutamate N-acetyltransferase/amino-acid acetyltransferase ArgJ [Planctomycetota bacterium]|jgi:glutamate N-acetyltransferase/amino-acid N-acetyltransferase